MPGDFWLFPLTSSKVRAFAGFLLRCAQHRSQKVKHNFPIHLPKRCCTVSHSVHDGRVADGTSVCGSILRSDVRLRRSGMRFSANADETREDSCPFVSRKRGPCPSVRDDNELGKLESFMRIDRLRFDGCCHQIGD